MVKRKRKAQEHKGLIKIEVLMTPELRDAANQVAKWDLKDRSQYIRDLILVDTRGRGALKKPGEEK